MAGSLEAATRQLRSTGGELGPKRGTAPVLGYSLSPQPRSEPSVSHTPGADLRILRNHVQSWAKGYPHYGCARAGSTHHWQTRPAAGAANRSEHSRCCSTPCRAAE